MLSSQLEQAIEIAYTQMLQDPHHSLIFKQRLPIYQAMKKLDAQIGAKVHGWLAVLAAQKVLPIWEKENPFDNFAKSKIELAIDLLAGKLTLEELEEHHQLTLMFLGGGLGQSGWDYSDEANYAYIAPDLALSEVMGDFLYKRVLYSTPEIVERQIEEGFPDEMMSQIDIDTASAAVCAYSGVSFDWDSLSKMGFNANDHSAEILEYVADTFHPNFDPANREDFWNWWLHEAIPQAYELAVGS
jgi:hypothetical protein